MSSEERVTAPLPSSFDRDLENARVLIEEPPWKDNPQKYRKVAEGILRRILTFDPTNKSAKRLLEKSLEIPAPVPEPKPSKVQAVVEVPIPAPIEVPIPTPKIETQVAVPKIEAPPAAPKMDIPMTPAPPPRRAVTPADFSFVVDTGRAAVQKKDRPKPSGFLLTLATVGAIAGVALLVAHRNTLTSQYTSKAHDAAPKVVQARPAVVPVASAETPNSKAATEARIPAAPPVAAPSPPAPAVPAVPVETAPKREAAPAQPAVVVKSNAQPVAPLETGTLAVSSPTTVDIYRGDQLVGSAPTTLILPAGSQTLEYRHLDMRKVVTSTIRANETTTATVTFDVTVQINAKPWAQVFIDGSPRRPLGQTPLSDVRVPIGSNLIFENPNFPGKNHRITGNEKEIRVTFP